MRIAINGYEAVVPRFGYDSKAKLPNRVGSSEFAFQLLKTLQIEGGRHSFLVYLPLEKTSDMPASSDNWSYVLVKGTRLWTLTNLTKRLILDRKKIDVFFSPTHYLPAYVPVPAVIAIMDLSYLHFPELFNRKDLLQLKIWGRLSIAKAEKIITISEASKNDIIKHYKVRENKVKVIYPGVKEISNIPASPAGGKYQISNMKSLKDKYGISGQYILFVGTLQPRKNVEKLVEAFSMLKDKALRLVIIGKKGWKFDDILNSPKKFKVEDRVLFLDFVPDEDLGSFYSNAICFVLPSLYEGFGLPILEAMKYDCPVVASNVSSLPEAGGDAAIYVNPQDPQDIAQKIEKLIGDKELRQDLIKKGREQVKKFSWEKAARETLKVLEEARGV